MCNLSDRIQLRRMLSSDSAAVLSLNHSSVSVTSPMDSTKFIELLGLSSASTVAVLDDACVGFVIVIEEGRDYRNDNYCWFSNQLNSFTYIDRVVVSSVCRGSGVGSRLYSQLLEDARRSGFEFIAAEIDIEPPNQSSLRFHRKLGFREIGTREMETGKRVSMQVCQLSMPDQTPGTPKP